MEKTIVHIDLNAFFAQAECLRDTSLAGKAIAVGYDGRRGVVSTASYEARKSGVSSGMPIAKAKELCPALIIVDGHYSYYRELSRQFFGYLKKRFPILEQASIDECYIDMTEEVHGKDIHGFLFDLQLSLYRVTRLKCSIGCGPNKFLAKMASDMKKPMGLTILDRESLPSLLWPLPIEKMYGVGTKTAPRLRMLGIETIGDLARTNDENVRKALGSFFDFLQGEANGWGEDVVDTSSFDPKSCSAERTFPENITEYEEIQDMIHLCSRDVARELRKYKKKATIVSLKLRDDHFVTRSKRQKMREPSDKEGDIFFTAMSIYDAFYRGESLRLVGVAAEKVLSVSSEDKETVL